MWKSKKQKAREKAFKELAHRVSVLEIELGTLRQNTNYRIAGTVADTAALRVQVGDLSENTTTYLNNLAAGVEDIDSRLRFAEARCGIQSAPKPDLTMIKVELPETEPEHD